MMCRVRLNLRIKRHHFHCWLQCFGLALQTELSNHFCEASCIRGCIKYMAVTSRHLNYFTLLCVHFPVFFSSCCLFPVVAAAWLNQSPPCLFLGLAYIGLGLGSQPGKYHPSQQGLNQSVLALAWVGCLKIGPVVG